METNFHLRARAVIYKDGKMLLARVKGKTYTFLPGGHIELGEKAEDALVREIMEELGKESSIKSFLGVIENSWPQDEMRQHEINLMFDVDVPDLDTGKDPVSAENNIEFLWSTIEDLGKNKILPPSLEFLIATWMSGNKEPWWGSHFI